MVVRLADLPGVPDAALAWPDGDGDGLPESSSVAGASPNSEPRVADHASTAEVRFPAAEWRRFRSHLEVAAMVLRDSGRGKLMADMRGWPMRCLRVARLWSFRDFRVELNPGFLEDGRVHYEIHTLKIRRFPRAILDHELVAVLTAEEVQDRQVIGAHLATWLEVP
jgi:hypothetical protein